MAFARKKQLSKVGKNGLFLGSLFPENFFGGQNFGHFLATFFRTFSNGSIFEAEKSVFGQKKWVFGQFFLKSGQPETVGAQGFAGFLANWPIIFYTIMRKNKKN